MSPYDKIADDMAAGRSPKSDDPYAAIAQAMAASADQRPQVAQAQAGPPEGILDIIKRYAANALGGAVRGAGSIGATLMAPHDMLNDYAQQRAQARTMSGMITGPTPTDRNAERRAGMDAALTDMGADPSSFLYRGAKLGTEVAGTLGVGGALGKAAEAAGAGPALVRALTTSGMSTGSMPATVAAKAADLGLRSVAGSGVGMTSAGLVNPEDAALGGVIGGVMPGAVKAAGLLGQAVGSGVGKVLRPNQETAALAQSAINQGIPLSAADVTRNQIVKGTRSMLDDVPLIGRAGAAQHEAVQEGFNHAVGGIFGAQAQKLTPQVMDSAKKAITGTLDRVWENNALKLDGQLIGDLSAIRAKAATKLNSEQAAQVERQIQELLGKAKNLQVDGGFANNWQSELRKLIEGEKGLHQSILSDLRRAVLGAFNRSVSPQDAQALGAAMGQYRAFKTVEPLVQKAEAGVAGRSVGDVSASLLPEAVRKQYGSVSRSPFGDLPQIGSQFVADRVMRTGGSARAAVQNSALGTALSFGAWHNPLIPAVAIPGAYAAERALTSPAFGRVVAGAKPAMTAQESELLRLLARSAPAIAAGQ